MSAYTREYKGRSLLEFPESYVSIDLETTGLDPTFNEIIEVAAVKYHNDMEIERFQTLVKPKRELDPFITDLTGITDEMLEDAPTIDSVLPQFLQFIGNSIVVGHNVNFDINFIYDNAQRLSLPPFSNNFVDTMRLSRRLYKEMPTHTLQALISYLGVGDTVEHRALADCMATQQCFLKMKIHVQETGASLVASWERYGSLSKTITPTTTEFNEDSPIYGKTFAFSGGLQRMTRKEAMQAVVNAGGICGDGVTAKTNYLVLPTDVYYSASEKGKSAKHKKAEKMQLNGFEIAIISEQVFYDMLEN